MENIRNATNEVYKIFEKSENPALMVILADKSSKGFLFGYEKIIEKRMENILYNELLYRGYNVDVGVVEIREGDAKKQLEVDFVCNQFYKRYYIQSVLSLPTREKTIQEERPLMNISDNFKKIIVVKDNIKPWITEEGISVIGLQEFLLNVDSLNL